MSQERVLVTGGSGFLAAHCIVRLLNDGYQVRATLRSLAREDEVRDMVRTGGADANGRLSFVQADLMSDAGWHEAAEGCANVLHVASPLPVRQPKDEDDLIRPAVEGTLRVLRAARDAGVVRVVLTSSYAAIGYGHGERVDVVDESNWTNIDAPGLNAYVMSKALAERAAWAFVGESGAPELAVVNPTVILGPLLGPDVPTSAELVKRMMDGSIPAVPRRWLGVVDSRDVAALHVIAMTDPAAAGQRFLATAGDFVSVIEIARALKTGLREAARKTPSRVMPDWLVRAVALVVPAARVLTPDLGRRKNARSDKARALLGWEPRPPEEAILATARSLIELGILR